MTGLSLDWPVSRVDAAPGLPPVAAPAVPGSAPAGPTAPASDRLVPVAVGYVLALAVLGSLAARFADPVGRALVARSTRARR